MIKYTLISILIILSGCTNYESSKYISFENEVIKEIIPELLNLENFQIPNIENVSIILINELVNEIEVDTVFDEEYKTISEDTVLLISREISPKSLEERELFKPFLTEKIRSRKLNTEIDYENLSLEQISLNDFQKRSVLGISRDRYNESITKVYLILTRISFNKTKEFGYMNFTILCGEACFWTNNIEIKEVNGKWIVSRLFSGGIA